MSKFVLTAQLKLQAPRNANKVLNDVRKQLKGVQIPVEVKGAKQATKQIDNLTNSTKRAESAATAMGRSFGLAIKRFAAFTVASRAVSLFTNSLANAVDEAIDFQREIVKIAQVTGKTVKELRGLQNTITQLSVGLGTSSRDLLAVSRILSQAGIRANDLEVALSSLAKTTLAPTFEDIEQTAEGAVAIISQFGEGVGALEKQLGAINAVAGQFAVESSDLIGAVRRFGGVFKAAGGELEELLGLFTAVRATTRESSESIATGLRTIFTRIQRPKTIEFLRQFGIELQNLDGTFVGPFEAAKRLSQALKGLGEGDLTFVRIAEELGGFRQIGKVIPLLQQFEVAERARQAAIAGGNSLTKDSETAQQALAVQIVKVKEEFLALVRSISDSSSFQLFARTALSIASNLIKVADAIKPLIPLIATLAAIKFSQGLGSFFGGAGSAIRGIQSFDPQRRNLGGKIMQFARGGLVPGQGNRDTVPAMLTPGEFVIKKSSVSKLGAGTLQAMNNNKFNNGTDNRGVELDKDPLRYRIKETVGQVIAKGKPSEPTEASVSTTLGKLREKSGRNLAPGSDPKTLVKLFGSVKNLALKKEDGEAAFSERRILRPLFKQGDKLIQRELKRTNPKLTNTRRSKLISDGNAKRTIGGFIFESFVSGLSGVRAGGETEPFDFTGLDSAKRLEPYAEQEEIPRFVDAKRTAKSPNKILKKAANEPSLLQNLQKFAMGGKVKVALYNSAGRVTGTTTKTRNLTLEEAIAAGFKRSVLTSGFGKEAVDRRLGTSAAAQAASRKQQSDASKTQTGATYGAAFLEKVGGKPKESRSFTVDGEKFAYNLKSAFLDEADAKKIKTDIVQEQVQSAVDSTASYLGGLIGEKSIPNKTIPNFQAIVGSIYEGGLAKVSGSALSLDADDSRLFDFAGGLGKAAGVFGPDGAALRGIKTDAKVASSKSALKSITDKVKNDLSPKKFAAGGNVGTDTVPALLTPGEFVINRSSAQRIGYGNLNMMNKKGVAKFATGGAVGVQRLNAGARVQKAQAFQEGSLQTNFNAAEAEQFVNILTQGVTFLNKEAKQLAAAYKEAKKVGNVEQTKALAAEYRDAKEAAKILVDTLNEVQDASGNFSGETGVRKEPPKTDPSQAQQEAQTQAKAQADSQAKAQEKSQAVDGAGSEKPSGPSGRERAQKIRRETDKELAKNSKEIVDLNGVVKDNTTIQRERASLEKRGLKSGVGTDKQVSDIANEARTVSREGGQREAFIEQEVQKLNAGAGSQAETGLILAPKPPQPPEDPPETGLTTTTPSPGTGLSVVQKKQKVATEETTKATKKQQKAVQENTKQTADSTAGALKLQTMFVAATAVTGALEFLKPTIDENSSGLARAFNSVIESSQFLITSTIGVITALQAFGLQLNAQSILGFFKGGAGFASKVQSRAFDLGGRARKAGGRITGAGVRRGGRLGKVQAEFGKSLGRLGKFVQGPKVLGAIGKFAAVLGPLVATIGIAVGVVALANKAIDAYTRVHEKAKKAIEDGDVARAEETAAASANAKAANKLAIGAAVAGATIGTAFGPVGTVVGGVIGALAGLIIKILDAVGVLGPFIEFFRDTVGVAFGGASTNTIKAEARLAAQRNKTQQELARNSQKSAEALQRVAAGASTLAQEFEAGNLTGNLNNQFAELTEQRALQESKDADVDGQLSPAARAAIGFAVAGPVGAAVGFLTAPDKEAQKSENLRGTLEAERKFSQDFNSNLDVLGKVAKDAALRGKDPLEVLRSDPNLRAATTFDEEKIRRLEAKGSGATEREKLELKIEKERQARFNSLKQVSDLQQKEAQRQLATIKALNFGLGGLTDQLSAASKRIEGLLTIDQVTNKFTSSVRNLEISLTKAANSLSDAEFESSIDDLKTSLADAGASEAQIANVEANTRGFKTANEKLNRGSPAFARIQEQLSKGDFNAETIRDTLQKELTKGVPPEVAEKINQAIEGAQIGEKELTKIRAGDFSAFTDSLAGISEKFNKDVLGVLREREKIEGLIIRATQQRLQSEKEFVDAQRKAIDIQLEAGKLFESFGGDKLTSDQKAGARLARFNVGTRGTGVRGLQSGDASEIQRVAGDIAARFNAQENRARAGVVGGKAAFTDADQDQRARLKTLQQDLIATTRKEIQARKEEIDLIKKKNAAEKSSLEKLLQGDVAGFLEDQNTAGAADALRSGDAALTSLFSASALGAGLKSLESTGESTTERAALALSSVGITDPSSAATLGVGGTEIERLNAEGRELTKTLSELGQQAAEFERTEINTKQAIINAAKVELSQVGFDRQKALNPRGLAKGGVVYASTGMFVPRGTDTVPAMLTPGEFVVNRSAVQRGNNLQILRAMNSTGSAASGPGRMSGGGQVQYYNLGGIVEGIGNAISGGAAGLQGVFADFTAAVNNLINSQFSVKLDTTNVNVNFNGGSFLATLREDIKNELLAEVGNEIQKYRANTNGDLQKSESITG